MQSELSVFLERKKVCRRVIEDIVSYVIHKGKLLAESELYS